MARLIKPPRGVFFVVGNGQGNAEILSVAGNGEYFDFTFQLDDYFEYALESVNLQVAETGVGTIVATAPNKGLFSRAVVNSTDGVGQALSLQQGETYVLLLKTSDEGAITEDPVSGLVSNTDPINKTVIALDFAQLKTQTIPSSSGVYFFVVYGAVPGDGRGGLFEWVPGSVIVFDDIVVDLDVNTIKSDNSVSGRYIRHNTGWIPEAVATAAMPTGSVSRDSGTKNITSYHSVAGLRIVPEVLSYQLGEWATLALLLAEASTYVDNNAVSQPRWRNGDVVTVLGYVAEGDVLTPLRLKWVTADGDVSAALGVTKWRPNDIAGGVTGRWVIVQTDQVDLFADNDATPSVKDMDVAQVAVIPPAAGYTTFDEMRDGKLLIVRPNVKAAKFIHAAGFKMPGGRDFWFLPNDPPALFYKNNSIIEVISRTPRPYLSEHVGDGTATLDIARVIDPTACEIKIDGAIILPSQITSITPNTPGDGQTRIVFSFNVTAANVVVVSG